MTSSGLVIVSDGKRVATQTGPAVLSGSVDGHSYWHVPTTGGLASVDSGNPSHWRVIWPLQPNRPGGFYAADVYTGSIPSFLGRARTVRSENYASLIP